MSGRVGWANMGWIWAGVDGAPLGGVLKFAILHGNVVHHEGMVVQEKDTHMSHT